MTAAYLCDAIRTPFGRFGGSLSHIRTDDLAALPVKALVERNRQVDWAELDEVVLGCANQAGEDNRNVARMALLLAGLPNCVPGVTVNRLCASGLEAVAYGARAIMAGEADLVMAGGVESMSRAPFVMAKAREAFSRTMAIEDTTIGWRLINPAMRKAYGVDSMPQTAENVASQFGITREDQDRFALRSQERTQAAIQKGFFAGEIMKVIVPAGKAGERTVDADEHPRASTTLAALAKLQPVVMDGGTVTAGNAAGINDGAAAVLLASEAAVKRHGLTAIAKILGYSAAGVLPNIMGVGPVPASRRLLSLLRLTIEDFDLVELNEAFAAQALAVLRQLGLADDSPIVNPNGGAIALGHPLGASGTRLVLTAARALRGQARRKALVTMCIGVGQGAAMALEAV